MIYTIGYDHLTPAQLAAVIRALGIGRLLDVRSVPYSQRPGFAKAALAKTFGSVYQWAGDSLGGRPPGVTRAGLAALAASAESGDQVLLCKEQSPGECHRYHTIALPLLHDYGLDCLHIFEDELIETSELEASIAEDRPYLCETFAL